MEEKEFKEESEKLQEILEKYKEVMEYYNLRLEAIPKIYGKDMVMLENMLLMYERKLSLMNKSIKKPYFARLDFLPDGEEKVEKIYIGKVGVMDEENNNITIDWRAPISSMYYDSNLGKASYNAPGGKYSGNLLVKRQYEIEEGKLKGYQDVDTVSNDEILKPYLNANADNRLKNIVSTIQSEQNAIIREPLNNNIIVQGVAGSGKTTVALHRIAYLVYNNRDRIKPEQYLVIGPNKFFVNYISGVLPDLDVNNVTQETYTELCSDFIGEDLELINEESKLIKSISNEKELSFEKLKVSMKYKTLIDNFINQLEKNIIPEKGITIKNHEIIPSNLIKQIYNSIQTNEIYNTIKKKTDRTKLLLEKYIEDNWDIIKQEAEEHEIDDKDMIKKLKDAVKKYFKNLIPSTLKLYEKFLNDLYMNDLEINTYISSKEKIKNNIQNIKNKKAEFEDLSALIYLKSRVIGNEKYSDYRQVAIDEAQDLGEFSFYALKELLNNATFSIFGDIAQSIYQYRSINNWEEVIQDTFKQNGKLKYLLKSYRTTAEIMNTANNITKYIGLDSAEPVIRHGDNVMFIPYSNSDSQTSTIIKSVEEYKQKGYSSIAIICKNEEEAEEMNERLKENNITSKIITDSDTEYNGGICTITSYLAKGLEFDGVIISDASEGKYNSNKKIDMKLLYVAMTRPLHELKILYNNKIVEPLEDIIK